MESRVALGYIKDPTMDINKLLEPIFKLPHEFERIESLTVRSNHIIMITDFAIYRIDDHRHADFCVHLITHLRIT